MDGCGGRCNRLNDNSSNQYQEVALHTELEKEFYFAVIGVALFFLALVWYRFIYDLFVAIFGQEIVESLTFQLFFAVFITVIIILIIRIRGSFIGIL